MAMKPRPAVIPSAQVSVSATRHMRAGNAAERAGKRQGLILQHRRPQSGCKRDRRALADRAQTEPIGCGRRATRSAAKSAARDKQECRSSRAARPARRSRPATDSRSRPAISVPMNGPPISALKPTPKNIQAQAGRELIGVPSNDHIGEDRVDRGAGERGGDDAEIRGAGQRRGGRSLAAPISMTPSIPRSRCRRVLR